MYRRPSTDGLVEIAASARLVGNGVRAPFAVFATESGDVADLGGLAAFPAFGLTGPAVGESVPLCPVRDV